MEKGDGALDKDTTLSSIYLLVPIYIIFMNRSHLKWCKAKNHSENPKMISGLFENGDTNKTYVKSGPDSLSGAKVLSTIADDKSWILFSTIARSSDLNGKRSGEGSQILLSKLSLARKQYYQRINRLTSLGPINRKNGRYNLSSFGRVLYQI
jgi:hypothetical protein